MCLHEAFTLADPKSAKNSQLKQLFALLWSSSVKAARKHDDEIDPSYRYHMANEHGEGKNFTCDKCNDSFPYNFQLQRHICVASPDVAGTQYSARRLIGSLWANIKVIIITEWFN